MKTLNKVIKAIAVIAAIVGIIYIVAVYGDKIVAWAKRTTGRIFNKRTRFFDIEEQTEVDDVDYDEIDAIAEPACED